MSEQPPFVTFRRAQFPGVLCVAALFLTLAAASCDDRSAVPKPSPSTEQEIEDLKDRVRTKISETKNTIRANDPDTGLELPDNPQPSADASN